MKDPMHGYPHMTTKSEERRELFSRIISEDEWATQIIRALIDGDLGFTLSTQEKARCAYKLSEWLAKWHAELPTSQAAASHLEQLKRRQVLEGSIRCLEYTFFHGVHASTALDAARERGKMAQELHALRELSNLI